MAMGEVSSDRYGDFAAMLMSNQTGTLERVSDASLPVHRNGVKQVEEFRTSKIFLGTLQMTMDPTKWGDHQPCSLLPATGQHGGLPCSLQALDWVLAVQIGFSPERRAVPGGSLNDGPVALACYWSPANIPCPKQNGSNYGNYGRGFPFISTCQGRGQLRPRAVNPEHLPNPVPLASGF